MKKHFLLLTAFLFCCLPVQSQNADQIIDSLKSALRKKPDAKKTAAIYSDLTWYYANVSIDSALHYGRKAIFESKKLGDSVLLAQVYSDVGAVYFRDGDFKNSKDNYLTAYKIRKARKDPSGVAKININLASIYVSTQQFRPAMKAYLEAIDYFESIKNEPVVYEIKVNLGYLFREMKNYPKAIQYIGEGIAYQRKNRQLDKLCVSCINMGNAYLEIKDTVKAIRFFNESMKACKITGNKKVISSLYNNLGNIKAGQKNAKGAMAFFDESQKVRDQLHSDLDNASLKINIAKLQLDAKEYDKARELLLGIKKVFKRAHSDSDLVLTYKMLIPVYAHLNEPDSASFYANQYSDLKEELLQKAALKQTVEFETKYQTAKKEKLLLENQVESKRKNYLLIAISALAFFIALVGFLIYRQQKLKNNQQEQEFQLKSAITQIETQNQLQEQRLNISRDLHDNIGAQLTFIISSVDSIKYAFDIENPKLDNKLQSISNFTKHTIVELRDTIWAMNNNEITFEELRARILNFIEKAKDAREEIGFQFRIDERLNQTKLSSISGMNIYRTIQEAVNNAIKYAEATEISIDVKSVDNITAIDIRDNGIGFDPAKTEKGNGLLNMEKRIEDIGGIFKVNSEFTKGTTISILLQ
jgi:signal transduction histidine kinase